MKKDDGPSNQRLQDEQQRAGGYGHQGVFQPFRKERKFSSAAAKFSHAPDAASIGSYNHSVAAANNVGVSSRQHPTVAAAGWAATTSSHSCHAPAAATDFNSSLKKTAVSFHKLRSNNNNNKNSHTIESAVKQPSQEVRIKDDMKEAEANDDLEEEKALVIDQEENEEIEV